MPLSKSLAEDLGFKPDMSALQVELALYAQDESMSAEHRAHVKAFWHRYDQDGNVRLSYHAVGEILGISGHSVRGRIQRVFKHLRTPFIRTRVDPTYQEIVVTCKSMVSQRGDK
jgi:hypothetical protein